MTTGTKQIHNIRQSHLLPGYSKLTIMNGFLLPGSSDAHQDQNANDSLTLSKHIHNKYEIIHIKIHFQDFDTFSSSNNSYIIMIIGFQRQIAFCDAGPKLNQHLVFNTVGAMYMVRKDVDASTVLAPGSTSMMVPPAWR